LSAAEDWVARRLLEGQSAAEIARARRRSVATVRNQIRKIYGKLGVGSRAELVACCKPQRTGG
jgi:DNA-binding CsgD family transcriptional regulator